MAARVVRTFLRSRVMVISTVLFPLLQLFMLLAFRLLVYSATGEAYVVLTPLMALVTAWSAILSNSIGFWTDLNSGIFTRLRAMPINMSSVLIGRVIGDLVRIMSAAAVIVVCALIPGFRLSRGVVAAVGFFVLITLFGAMCSAVSIAVGMSAQHPGIIVKWVQLPTLTLTLMSSGYVPLHAFPGWIQPLVAVNAISVTTEALVGLSHGWPAAGAADRQPGVDSVLRRGRDRRRQATSEGLARRPSVTALLEVLHQRGSAVRIPCSARSHRAQWYAFVGKAMFVERSLNQENGKPVTDVYTHRVMPIITVDDMDQARRTYIDVLGMVEVMDHGWIVTLSNRADSNTQLSLITKDQTAPCNPVASIEVDDVDEAFLQAERLGLEIVHPLTDEEWGVRRFFFRDHDGNVVNVLSHL
ncbi:ABC transporter permease [Jatrophihabitans sp. DSM 44399]|uniref:ABC transporter permease n=2 Tax=Jatrophihabitans lederbergiae TaxID=3075547 RepID=A0ABU2JA01_9ACTN|nr:VOC family protein [Jatrophihabitans sp. DSM 44399]MDT0261459.1 ABC transporter permease [Jatrophihabitans sp. DSM 44399]